MSESYYKYHVFFCTNQREAGQACCQDFNSLAMRDYMKKRTKALGLVRQGIVRVNTAGCLNRCQLGPTIVVYPEATWYTYKDEKDIEDIINMHLVNGNVVDRLKVD